MAAKTLFLIGICIVLYVLNTASAHRKLKKVQPCKDRNKNCRRYVKRAGGCSKHPNYRELCPRACGYCKDKKRTSLRVKEIWVGVKRCTKSDLSNCAAKKKTNACNNAKAYMKKRCPRTCGYCVGSAKKPREKERKVKKQTTKMKRCTKSDKNTCAGLKKHNACNSSKRYMKKYCARTCGFCVGSAKKPRTVKKETAKVKQCKRADKNDCPRWKKIYGCKNKRKSLMKTNCAHTCGFCAGSAQKPRKVNKVATEVKRCTKSDSSRSACAKLMTHNGCERLRLHMKQYCARACGFCVGSPKKSRCKDGNSKCAGYAKRGFCVKKGTVKNKRYMRKHCRQSCGFCAKKG